MPPVFTLAHTEFHLPFYCLGTQFYLLYLMSQVLYTRICTPLITVSIPLDNLSLRRKLKQRKI